MSLFRRPRTVRSERLYKRRLHAVLWKFGIGCFLIIILLVFASWVTHRPALQVMDIVVQGNQTISAADVETVARSVLIGKYFLLFPRSNSLIYPEKDIESGLLSAFTRIASTDIVRTNLHTLTIEVTEREAYALWCRNGEALQGGECYFLNTEGLIFSKAPNFTGNVFFRFYGDVGNGEPIGKRYLETAEEFGRMTLLIDSVRGLNLVPVELLPLSNDDFELYMEDGSKIIFGKVQRSSQIVDNLKAVLESNAFQQENTGSIDYIDLRFGNKVYYKLK